MEYLFKRVKNNPVWGEREGGLTEGLQYIVREIQSCLLWERLLSKGTLQLFMVKNTVAILLIKNLV